jgi:hypothetical protein
VREPIDLAELEARLRARTGHLPAHLPQQTFPEARAAGTALADGPTLSRWAPLPSEAAFSHAVPDQPLQVHLAAPPGWDERRLSTALRAAGLGAVLLLHVGLGAVLAAAEPVTLELDVLLRAVGRYRNGRQEREAERQRLAEHLQLIGALAICGRRDGTFRDRQTRAPLDLPIREPLLQVLALEGGAAAPEQVTLAAGPWLARFRGNHRVLATFGEVGCLAELPGRQAGGAWAQSLGLALQQRWREQATYAQRQRGPDGSISLRFRPFRRRELLTLFRPDPPVEAILAGDHPKRGLEYWNEAIGLLVQQGLLRERPLPVQPTRSPVKPRRQGWERAWLEEALEFTPAGPVMTALQAIAAPAHARRGRRAAGPTAVGTRPPKLAE